MKIFLCLLCLYCFGLPSLGIIDTRLAFDLDETLIESNKLSNKALKQAQRLGFEIKSTKSGLKYIIRPGAFEVLSFAKEQGFDLDLMTLNNDKYAEEILKDSGMDKYFSRIISREDMTKDYNRDFKTYPNHRNKLHYPKHQPRLSYIKNFWQGYIIRSLQKCIGNSNIGPYIPCTSCDKYPPIYGIRVLIDNAKYNVEDPVDFVGILVNNFEAKILEPQNKLGDYIWADKVKTDIGKIKSLGWIEFYKLKYGKYPIIDEVKVIN